MGKKTVKIYSLKGFISFMDNFLNKLERKFGRYAIPDLIRYVIILYCAGAVIGMINENIYYEYLCLDMSAVFRGQIWRLVTFLIEPYGFSSGMGMLLSILFFLKNFFQLKSSRKTWSIIPHISTGVKNNDCGFINIPIANTKYEGISFFSVIR